MAQFLRMLAVQCHWLKRISSWRHPEAKGGAIWDRRYRQCAYHASPVRRPAFPPPPDAATVLAGLVDAAARRTSGGTVELRVRMLYLGAMRCLAFLVLLLAAPELRAQSPVLPPEEKAAAQPWDSLQREFDRYAATIDSTDKVTDTLTVRVDSTEVSARISPNRICAKVCFIESGTLLEIDYYFSGEALLFYEITERSTTDAGFARRSYAYADESGEMEMNSGFPVMHGIQPSGMEELCRRYGYNPAFTEDFLVKYCAGLLAEVGRNASPRRQ